MYLFDASLGPQSEKRRRIWLISFTETRTYAVITINYFIIISCFLAKLLHKPTNHPMKLPLVKLLTRPGCVTCDKAKFVLKRIKAQGVDFEGKVVNIL